MPSSPLALPHDLPFDPFEKILPPSFSEIPKMGLEFEIFVFDSKTFEPLGSPDSRWKPSDLLKALEAYGPPGTHLAIDPPTGVLTGLVCPTGCGFSLEPGGQLEFATSVHTSLESLLLEVVWALELLEKATKGELVFLSHGTHPTAPASFPLLVPKERYGILNRYLSSVPNGRGTHMMRRTATVQPNLDTIGGLEGWRQSVRTVAAVSQTLSQMWANSQWFEGKCSTHTSERQEIWNHTDPSRTGYAFTSSPFYPHSCGEEGAYGMWAWNAYVLIVPSLPIDEQPLYGELPFWQWWASGYKGIYPNKSNWEQHLTTLFPHLRLRGFLEIRDVDTQDFSSMAYPLAVWGALLHCEEGLRATATWDKKPPTGQQVMDVALGLAQRNGKGQRLENLVTEAYRLGNLPKEPFIGTALDFVKIHSTAQPSLIFRQGHGL